MLSQARRLGAFPVVQSCNWRRNLKIHLAAVFLALVACSQLPIAGSGNKVVETREAKLSNPVYHFEIPVVDLDRAVRFYEAVLGYELMRKTVDGYAMAFFPRADGKPVASGALAKGYVYVPSKDRPII